MRVVWKRLLKELKNPFDFVVCAFRRFWIRRRYLRNARNPVNQARARAWFDREEAKLLSELEEEVRVLRGEKLQDPSVHHELSGAKRTALQRVLP